ncbi:N-acetyltransferase [Nocardioides sp. OK12]|uniref:GNAT family N-acetyltransferase n=1 Tax=Nocardioides sp. OK12 TaxID=2758661 RepID=UPI0027D1F02D|nr:GNAT family N-acetyltransferase [Nocardioides sp. OK12]GHJ59304.1 N-acetyltransferase [Nocardioides sp. OK12]
MTSLRAATVADAEALGGLHVDAWDDAYTGLMPQRLLEERRAALPERVEMWREILTARAQAPDAPVVWLAEDASGLVGFASALPARDDDPALPGLELTALYVRARCWGTGLGHRLLEAAVGDRAAYLWVLAGNERATGFYERHGFVLDGAVDDSDDHGRHLRMVRR